VDIKIQTPKILIACCISSILMTVVVPLNCKVMSFPAKDLLLVSRVALSLLIKMSLKIQKELAIVKMDWRFSTDFVIHVVSSIKAVLETRSLKMLVGVLLTISSRCEKLFVLISYSRDVLF